MGGKTAQSTSNVSVPDNVKAMYTSAANAAQTAAASPFQQYSTDPNAFVAGLTGTQQAAIQNTNAAQGSYQPFYNQSVQSLYAGQQAANPLQAQAAQFGLAGAQGVDPSQLGAQQINQYMSPYLNSVVQSTLAPLQQQQQQQQSALVGDQIGAGAFGGDRGGIAQANLAQQQNMATAQIVSGLMNQGYGQALSTAQQQQGVGLGAAQANRAAQQQAAGQMAALGQQDYSQGMGTSQQLANLGTGAQQNQLSSAQAQIGMGTAEQQTQQAGLQALYNQFLQQQGYPFQTAQFLTNQMATLGPLYGTTTTKDVPADILGTPQARGGAIERKSGGLVPSSEGGAVSPAHAGLGFAYGGSYSPEALAGIIQMQKAMFPFAAESGSRVGGGTGPLGVGLVPANPKPLEYGKFDVRDKSEPSFNDKLLALLKENSTTTTAPASTTTAPASYRGGVAGSSHYAAGGSLPYATDTSYVPQQQQQKDSSGLLGADSSSSTRGGGAAADLVRLQTLFSLFSDKSSSKKNGGVAGRQGYQTLGAVQDLVDPNAVPKEDTPEEDTPEESSIFARDLGRGDVSGEFMPVDVVPKIKISQGNGLAPVPPEDTPEPTSFAESSLGRFLARAKEEKSKEPAPVQNLEKPEITKLLLSEDPSDRLLGQQQLTQQAPATPTAGLAPVPTKNVGTEPEAALRLGTYDPLQTHLIQNQPPVIGGFIPPAQAAAGLAGSAAPKGNQGEEPEKNWFARNKDWMLPLAKGLEATLHGRGGKFLPAALLQGAATGALSVPGLQKQAADVAEAQETVKTKQLSNEQTAMDLYNKYKFTANMRGETPVSYSEFVKQFGIIGPPSTQAPQGAEATAPQIPGKVNLLGKASLTAAEKEGQAVFGPNAEAAKKASQDYMTTVRNSGLAAAQNTLNTNEMAKVVSKTIAGKDLDAPGTAFAARAELVRAINTTLRAFGSTVTVGESDTQKDLYNKYATFMGSGIANNVDQNSLGALQAMMGALPQGEMTPAAQVQLASQLMVTNQQAKDRQAHLNQYNEKTGGLNSYYNAQQAFEDDNRPRYLAEQEFLKRIMTNSDFMVALTSGVGTADRIEMNLQRIAKENGIKYIPGMSRYFERQ